MFRFPYQMYECPVCGRPLQVRDEYVGKEVICPHCRGRFVAHRSMSVTPGTSDPAQSLLGKADRLLQISARRLAHVRQQAAQPTAGSNVAWA